MSKISFTLAVFVVAVLSFFLIFSVSAQAETNSADLPNPTFGLYCEEDNIIKNGTVKFDLTNLELFSHKKALKEAEYIVSGNKAVTFEIPFLSSYIETPQFNVTVNGQTVTGEVWYGENEVMYGNSNSCYNALSTDNSVIKERLEMLYSSALDETIKGTLFTLTPDKDIMTVTFKSEQPCGFIYDGINLHTQSYNSETQVWTFDNALSHTSYKFFFVGESIDFTATCGFQAEELTFKNYIDSNYDMLRDYYEKTGVSETYLYYVANKLLHNKRGMAFIDFFCNYFDRVSLNSYKFIVPLNGETTIKYSSEVVIQADYGYEPTVYLIGQKQLSSYPTNYTVTLNNEVPYIIQSSVQTSKSKNTYTANSNENFYFICCSVSGQSGLSTARLVICIVFGIIGGIGLITAVVIVGFIIRKKTQAL